MDHHKRVQTSEAFINSAFLAVSGGFQDAYTYFTRDGVFSNAQTGNVVLMSERFMNGEVKAGLHYLIPLTAFFLGVLLAERIQEKFRYARRLHWRISPEYLARRRCIRDEQSTPHTSLNRLCYMGGG